MSKFDRKFGINDVESALLTDLLRHWLPAGAPISQRPPAVPEDHLRLAIRDGYLNFYRAGQSVAKVSMVRGKLQAEVHNKYFTGDDNAEQKYVKVTDATYRDNLVHRWILNANRYVDKEKNFVDGVVSGDAVAIDLEAGLPADPKIWAAKVAPRIDLVTLEPCGDHHRLVFWEAKLVTNQEARCKDTGAPPKVIGQLKKYEQWIAENRKTVCQAYQNCCRDLVKLHSLAKRVNPDIPELGKAIVAVAEGTPLCVDSTPRLLIDAREGDAGFTENGHLKKLHERGVCVHMVRTGAATGVGA